MPLSPLSRVSFFPNTGHSEGWAGQGAGLLLRKVGPDDPQGPFQPGIPRSCDSSASSPNAEQNLWYRGLSREKEGEDQAHPKGH